MSFYCIVFFKGLVCFFCRGTLFLFRQLRYSGVRFSIDIGVMKINTLRISAKDLKKTLKSVFELASSRRVVIRRGSKVLLDLPIGVVGVGAVLSPVIFTGITTVFVVASQLEVDVYHDEDEML